MPVATPRPRLPRRICPGALLLLLLGLQVPAVSADTLVDVETTLGSFRLRLFDDLAPATVALFRDNVESGRYSQTMIHYADDLVFAGGVFSYSTCSQGMVPVPFTGSAPIEPTGLLNNVRTIAMVPDPTDPTRVTGQWLINLGDNESFYDPQRRPVVFGEVIEGFAIADTISTATWWVPIDPSASVPTINYNLFGVQCGLFTRDNTIQINMNLAASEPVNFFDSASQMLHAQVDTGESGILALTFRLLAETPQVVVQVQPESVQTLSEAPPGVATFSAASGQLLIPELYLNGMLVYRDLLFTLSDPEQLLFTLQSFSE